MIKKVSCIAITSLLCACSSVNSGNKQELLISTSPYTVAECTLTNEDGREIKMKAPGKVKVKNGEGKLNIKCDGEKATGSTTIDEGIAYAGYMNILMPPGFIYDYATGALFKYDDEIVVNMTPKPVKPKQPSAMQKMPQPLYQPQPQPNFGQPYNMPHSAVPQQGMPPMYRPQPNMQQQYMPTMPQGYQPQRMPYPPMQMQQNLVPQQSYHNYQGGAAPYGYQHPHSATSGINSTAFPPPSFQF